jgi:hypothetical protein
MRLAMRAYSIAVAPSWLLRNRARIAIVQFLSALRGGKDRASLLFMPASIAPNVLANA